MQWINEYIQPGVYEHYKGDVYVVTEVVTHADNPETGKMEPLTDPLVVYRDLEPVMKHHNGRHQYVHQRYCRKLSEFTGTVTREDGTTVERFRSV